MSYNRKLDFFNKHRIIYRRDPINDTPTEVYDWGSYYENGTNECYTLFRSKAKINTYKSLKWHMLVIWYLNPQLTHDRFSDICIFMCNKINGFVTFEISSWHFEQMVYDVLMSDLERPPKNKSRKIIFKEYTGLTLSEKMKIVGRLVGRSSVIDEESIYQCMLDLHDDGKKITITRIAGLLDCSARTIYRNMGNELKKEKELLNQQL